MSRREKRACKSCEKSRGRAWRHGCLCFFGSLTGGGGTSRSLSATTSSRLTPGSFSSNSSCKLLSLSLLGRTSRSAASEDALPVSRSSTGRSRVPLLRGYFFLQLRNHLGHQGWRRQRNSGLRRRTHDDSLVAGFFVDKYAEYPVFIRSSVTLLILPPAPCDTISAAPSLQGRCILKQAQLR